MINLLKINQREDNKQTAALKEEQSDKVQTEWKPASSDKIHQYCDFTYRITVFRSFSEP